MVKGIIAKQDVAIFLCNNLDHYTEWLSLNIFSHKIVSLTTKIDWKNTKKNDYRLETKLANCEGTTETVAQMAFWNVGQMTSLEGFQNVDSTRPVILE